MSQHGLVMIALSEPVLMVMHGLQDLLGQTKVTHQWNVRTRERVTVKLENVPASIIMMEWLVKEHCARTIVRVKEFVLLKRLLRLMLQQLTTPHGMQKNMSAANAILGTVVQTVHKRNVLLEMM